MIRVHDTEFDGFKELVYHQDRVRSVLWSTEIPWLLASGGDDSIQALWDVRERKLLHVREEPTLAMTSFTSHPDKPFSYFSSHFDSSIIQWSLNSLPDVALSMLKILMGCPDIECHCDNVH